MNRQKSFLFLALLACLMVGTIVLAAPEAHEGGLAINWWTVEGGGGQSSGGPYVLMGTAGQPDVYANDCGRYFLAGGFWTPPVGITGACELFLPTITK